MAEIDRVSIAITASAKAATDAIRALETALRGLRTVAQTATTALSGVAGNVNGVRELAESMKLLAEAAQQCSGANGDGMKNLAKAAKSAAAILSGIDTSNVGNVALNVSEAMEMLAEVKIPTDVATQLLECARLFGRAISALMNACSDPSALAEAARSLNEAIYLLFYDLPDTDFTKIMNISTFVDTMVAVASKMNALSNYSIGLKQENIENLVEAVSRLSGITPMDPATANAISQFASALQTLSVTSANLDGLVKSFPAIVNSLKAASEAAAGMGNVSFDPILDFMYSVLSMAKEFDGSGIAAITRAMSSMINSLAKLNGFKGNFNGILDATSGISALVGIASDMAGFDFGPSADSLSVLISALSRLSNFNGSFKGGLEPLLVFIRGIVEELPNMNLEGAMGNIEALKTLMKALSNLGVVNINMEAISGLPQLLGDLVRLSAKIGDGGNVGAVNALLDSIQKMSALNGIKGDVVKSITNFVKAIGELAKSANSKSIKNIPSMFDAIAEGLRRLTEEDIERLREFCNAVSGLANVNPKTLKLALGITGEDKLDAVKNKALTLGDVFKEIGKAAARAWKLMWGGIKAVYNGVKKLISAMSKLNIKTMLANTAFGKLMKTFARRASMMAMRAVIKEITSAFSDGLEALYHNSAEVQKTLNSISTSLSGLKASAGSTLYSFLNMISGALQTVINMATQALNAISALFSALSGATSYFKGVTKATTAYDDATKSAGKSAKKTQQQLMGFDEINKLNDNSSGGGGSGGSSKSWEKAGAFEKTDIPELLKNAVATGNFALVGKAIAKKINDALKKIDWAKIKQKAAFFGKAIQTLITGFVDEIDPDVLGTTIAEALNTALTAINWIWNLDFVQIGSKIGAAINKMFAKIDPKAVADFIVRKLKAVIGILKGLLTSIDWTQVGATLQQIVNEIAANIKTIDLPGFAQVLCDSIVNALSTIKGLLKSKAGQDILASITGAIIVLFDNLPDIIGGLAHIAVIIWNSIVKACEDYFADHSLKDWLVTTLTNIGEAIKSEGGIEFPVTLALVFGTILGLEVLASTLKAVLLVTLGRKLLPGLFSGGAGGAAAGGVSWSGIALKFVKGAGFVAGVAFSIDAIVNTVKMITGEITVTGTSIAKVISSALIAAGSFVLFAHPVVGAILIGLGVTMRLLTSLEWDFEDADASSSSAAAIGKLVEGDHAFDFSNLDDSWFENGKTRLLNQLEVMQNDLDWFTMPATDHAGLKDGLEKILGFSFGDGDEGLSNFYAAVSAMSGIAVDATTSVDDLFEAVSKCGEVIVDAFKNSDNMEEAAEKLREIGKEAGLSDDQIDILLTTFGLLPASGKKAGRAIDDVADSIKNLKDVSGTLDDMKDVFNSYLPKGSTVTIDVDDSNATRGLNDLQKKMKAATATKTIKINASLTSSANSLLASLKGFVSGDAKVKLNNVLNSLKGYATGGFPTRGEMFIANERGAELVGSINGRSAVANQGEIGDAIFRYMDKYSGGGQRIDENRLASAIVSGCKAAGMGAVYLDGKMLAQSINRESRRTGKSAIR